jgi:hypothetical protein
LLNPYAGADKEFHKGVKQEAERALRADPRTAALVVSCPGGGRIRHEPALGKVLRPSAFRLRAYGLGDHAAALRSSCRRAFPGLQARGRDVVERRLLRAE